MSPLVFSVAFAAIFLYGLTIQTVLANRDLSLNPHKALQCTTHSERRLDSADLSLEVSALKM